MSDFNKGVKVKLKSGGPTMVIESLGDYSPLGPEEGAKCVWFQETKGVSTPQEHVYDIAVLELA